MCSSIFIYLIWFLTYSFGSEVPINDGALNFSSSNDSSNRIYKREIIQKIVEENESQKWFRYLEEDYHFLYGSQTPIFLAKIQKQDPLHHLGLEIIYERRPFEISDVQLIERMDRSKRDAPEPLFSTNRNEEELNYTLDSNYTENDENINNNSKKSLINSINHHMIKKRASSTEFEIFVKILVVVDYDTWKFHGKDYGLMTTYITALLNGVDLRFRQMNNPKIRLNLAGIIIPEEPYAADYLECPSYLTGKKDGQEIIRSMERYFSRNFANKKLCDYDVVFGIVKKPMVHKSIPVKGSVAVTSNWNKALSVGVFSDDGSLGSIFKMTQALGSILGAPKDDGTNLPGSPCFETDGYLMGDGLKNGLFWSNCSIKGMQNHLNRSYYAKEKMTKKPRVGKPLKKKLPGKLYNRNQQCKMIKGDSISNKDKDIDCLKLKCETCSFMHEYVEWDFLCSSVTTSITTIDNIPAEGSSCGAEKICLNGQCVRDVELSDY